MCFKTNFLYQVYEKTHLCLWEGILNREIENCYFCCLKSIPTAIKSHNLPHGDYRFYRV